MLGLAGNAPGPVLAGSQDFRARRPCRLSPIQLTVETTIVVEDGYQPRRLDKKAETRSTMDACPRWKDAPSGPCVLLALPEGTNNRLAVQLVAENHDICGRSDEDSRCSHTCDRTKAEGWGTELCAVGRRRKRRSFDPLCSLGVTALFVMRSIEVSHPCDRKKSQGWGTELCGVGQRISRGPFDLLRPQRRRSIFIDRRASARWLGPGTWVLSRGRSGL